MSKSKPNDEDLPGLESLNNLSIDWDFKPESTLGLRANSRITNKYLQELFNNRPIPTKIATKDHDETGEMLDLSPTGSAIYLQKQLQIGTLLKFGFIMGDRKIITKALIKNTSPLAAGYRTGIEFIDLPNEHLIYIKQLLAAISYKE